MTELIAERARTVVAVELDAALANELRQKFRSRRVEILATDILTVDVAALCQPHHVDRCFAFGNLPYSITSPIIHHLLNFRKSIRGMSLLVQREVAQRITATPGTRDYGYLSILAQLSSRPRIVLNVPPGAFSPAPKVYSALVDFQMEAAFPGWEDRQQERFLEFVKRSFAHKRKKLVNNLSGIYSREQVVRELARLGLPAGVRAEQLPIERFVQLYRELVRTEHPTAEGPR